MKIKFKLPVVVLGLMLLFAGTTVKAQDDDVSLQQFYDELSPYGSWIKDPQYGYVWRPDVDQAEFRPYYTNGRWVQTEYGNTWVSNYDWGWAPFHYGRWMYDRSNSWIWLPDTVWGPAWVDWRSGGGYYGWAPMGPTIGIHVNLGSRYYRPDYCWNFVPQHNIYYGNFGRYRSYNNVTIINRTRIINNTYVHNRRTYYTGPRPEEVRRATNQQVPVYNIARNSRSDAPSIDRNTVNIYSPRPTRTQNNNPAPASVGTYSSTRGSTRSTAPAGRIEGTRSDRANPAAPAGRIEGARTERVGSGAPATAPARTGTNRGEAQGRYQGTAPQAPRTQTAPPRQESRGTQARTQEAPKQDRQMSTPPPQQRQPQPAPQQRPQVQQRAPQQAPQSRGTESRSGGGREATSRPGRG